MESFSIPFLFVFNKKKPRLIVKLEEARPCLTSKPVYSENLLFFYKPDTSIKYVCTLYMYTKIVVLN